MPVGRRFLVSLLFFQGVEERNKRRVQSKPGRRWTPQMVAGNEIVVKIEKTDTPKENGM